MGRVDGKVALISGGSRGMGPAHAELLVAEGARVVIGDILDDDGKALAESLGDAARYVHLDVTEPVNWEAAVATAVTEFGKLDVLVNNAGIVNGGPLQRFDLGKWRHIIDVNLTGTFLGMRAVVDPMIAAGGGSIINVSSIEGLRGAPWAHGYVASKWGVRGLAKSAALELAPHNPRVNSLHPGLIRTPMTAGIPDDLETWRQAFYARDLAGTVVLVGVPTPDMRIDMPLLDFFSHGGSLKSSWYGDCLPERDFPTLLELYRQDRLPLDLFVSERIALDQVEKAFDTMKSGLVLRSVVVL